MAVEVELLGGPQDGTRTVIDADPMNPPLQIETLHLPELNWSTVDDDEYIHFRKLVYQRTVGPADGPLWVYRLIS